MKLPLGIVPLKPGDTARTMLSASVANELIAVANAILAMKGAGGIEVLKSDAGYVIRYTGIPSEAGDTPPQGGTPPAGGGGIAFKGQYSAVATYDQDDVVIAWTTTDMGNLVAGTYISLQDANTGNALPSAETAANSWWSTLARGHWSTLYIASGGASYASFADGNMEVKNGGGATLVWDSTHGSWPAGANSKTFFPQQITVCDSGTEKTMWVLGTTPTV